MARLNREKALSRIDGDETVYQKMAGYFIRDYTDYPERIRELIAGEDAQAYVLTHSLKNISASLGAEDLAAGALGLEGILKQENFAQTGAALNALLEEFSPVLEEIRKLRKEDGTPPESDGATENWSDFGSLLDGLARAMGSFSPEKVERAMNSAARYADLIPGSCKEDVERILALGREFRYLDGEEMILELKKRVLE